MGPTTRLLLKHWSENVGLDIVVDFKRMVEPTSNAPTPLSRRIGSKILETVTLEIQRNGNFSMKMDSNFWRQRIADHVEVVTKLSSTLDFLSSAEQVGNIIFVAYETGKKLLLCGNGGSAADCQHIAAEFVGRFYLERRPLPAEALTVNTSCLTAIGNDYAYDEVFSRQVSAKGNDGDVLLGISTSGNSKNVVNAMVTGNDLGLVTVGLTGSDRRCDLAGVADHCIFVPTDDTPRIQEAHILIAHMLCEFVESRMFRAVGYTGSDSRKSRAGMVTSA